MAPRTLIFIPTYNERDNVESMATQVLGLDLDADLLFLDDDSPDGTGSVLDRIAAGSRRVQVLHRKGKRGVGSAHLDGIAWAYDRGYETLITMDCDFTHAPSDMTRLLAAARDHDVAVGSRYLQSGSLPGWNPVRRFLTTLGHFLTRRLLGMPYDATGAYRVYRLSRIPRQVWGLVTSMGYAFFFESLFVLHRSGCSIAQVPIVLPARTYGHSKMSFLEPYRSLKQVVALSIATALHPGQFRLAVTAVEADPAIRDPQGWDAYWERKRTKSAFAYEIVATLYRNLVIRRRLESALHRHMPRGTSLLHAGSGGGQVDRRLSGEYRVTAVDVSLSALRLYTENNPGAAGVRHASVFSLPFPEATFDGGYSLGLLEHFTHEEIGRILGELRRVLKPGGTLVLFWPHRRATSVAVLGIAHWLLNDVLGKGIRFHPPEISLLRSRAQAEGFLGTAGFDFVRYSFGPGDGFVQAVVVGRKAGPAEERS